MKTAEQLVQNAIGQLNGIKKMIQEERECGEVIIQIKAVKAAINKISNKFLEEYLENCVQKNCTASEKELIISLFREIINNN